MKLIPLKQVMEMTSLGRSTIYRYISEDKFPKQVALGAKNSAWVEQEVLDWIASRIAERNLSLPCSVADEAPGISESKRKQVWEERDRIVSEFHSNDSPFI